MRFVILHYHVLKNAGSTIEEILERDPTHLIISPGPCTPNEAGISVECVRRLSGKLPLLGVCLGHQSIGQAFGGEIVRAGRLMHGKTDQIRHDGRSIYQGSMYDYFREKPNPADPVSAIANQSSLGDFIARLIERIPHQVQDVQVQLLANGDVYDHTPAEDDLERAIRRMRNTSLLGVLDLFSESLIAGQYFLRPVFPSLDCAQPAVDVSRGAGGTLDMRVSKLRAACDPRVRLLA